MPQRVTELTAMCQIPYSIPDTWLIFDIPRDCL